MLESEVNDSSLNKNFPLIAGIQIVLSIRYETRRSIPCTSRRFYTRDTAFGGVVGQFHRDHMYQLVRTLQCANSVAGNIFQRGDVEGLQRFTIFHQLFHGPIGQLAAPRDVERQNARRRTQHHTHTFVTDPWAV